MYYITYIAYFKTNNINFDKPGAAEMCVFSKMLLTQFFFSSSHIFLTLPKNETKKIDTRPTLM